VDSASRSCDSWQKTRCTLRAGCDVQNVDGYSVLIVLVIFKKINILASLAGAQNKS
jgi:hypothetical protein